MSCKECRGKEFRSEIIKYRGVLSKPWMSVKDSGDRSWKEIFLDEAICPKRTASGGYKCVYIFENNIVVSVQISDKKKCENIRQKYNKFLSIEGVQKYLNYPGEIFMVNNYLVANLPYCQMDLFSVLEKAPKYIGMIHYRHLLPVLIKLHSKKIYLGDIKPENIFVCGNALSFGDLDDALVSEEDFASGKVVGTLGYAPLLFDKPFLRYNYDSLEINDIYALSVVLCLAYELIYLNDEQMCAIYAATGEINNKTGKRLKITWDDTIYWHVNISKRFINSYYLFRTGERTLKDLVQKKNILKKVLTQKLKI